MADALSYEYLLRRVYKGGRFGKKEMNADVYRKLERAALIYKQELNNAKIGKPKSNSKSIEDLEYNYRVECAVIWRYIYSAITVGMLEHKDVFSKNETTALETALNKKDILKEDIDFLIDLAEGIFVAHKIFPT